MRVRRLFSISLSIAVIIAQLMLPLSRALASPSAMPGPAGAAPQQLPPWLPLEHEPVTIPVADDEVEVGAGTPAEPAVPPVTIAYPSATAAPRQSLQTPLGTGNNNYGQTQRDTDNPQNHPGHHFAGPVNLLNGNFFLTVGDLFIPGRGLSLQLARSYNSLAAADGMTGTFGYGWTHSYETQVISETGGITLTVREADGALHDYHSPQACDGSTCYESPPGLYRQLRIIPGLGYQVIHKNGTIQQFEPDGRLVEIVDRYNNHINLYYGLCGAGPDTLCRVEDSSGRSLVFTYWPEGLIQSVTDNSGRAVSYSYEDGLGNLTAVNYPEGSAASYVYDGQHRMVEYDDPRQPEGMRQAEQIAYDAQNRATTFTCDSFFDVFFSIDYAPPPPLGELTDFLSHPEQNPVGAVEITDGEGQLTRVEYDGNGNITYEGDYFLEPGGYDWWWGKWWWWYPDWGYWWLLYGKVDANYHTTSYAYDDWGNTTVVLNALGATQRFLWEEPFYETGGTTKGNILSATNSLSVTTLYQYDYAGNTMTEIQAAGTADESATVYESDEWGQLVRQTDNAGQTTAYAYDAFGNTAVITDAQKGVTRNGFDAVGRPITTTDQAGNDTIYVYDDTDRLLSVTDPEEGTTSYAYSKDGRDNLVQLVNANGVTTTFAYDSLDRLITQTNSLSQTTTYEYDSLNRLIRRTDADGRVTLYEYDAKSRMTKAEYYAAGGTEHYQVNEYLYDGAGNLVWMANENVRLTYEYDDLDQRTKVEMWTPTWEATRTLQLARDSEAGNLTQVSGPGGYELGYEYDPLNRLVAVRDVAGSTTYSTTYEYDTAGRLEQVVYPGDATGDYDYNGTNHLTGLSYDLSGEETVSYTYAYDASGNLVGEVDEGEVYTYTYDEVGRIVTATSDLHGETSFGYDGVGNRLTAQGPAGGTEFTYDAHSRLTQAGDATFTLNEMGARTETQMGAVALGQMEASASGPMGALGGTGANASAIHYSYDNDMRLVQVDPGLTFLYDPLGNLIGTVDGEGNYRYFLRDGEDIYLELDGSGKVVAQYVIGADGVLSMWRDAHRYLFLTDGRGRVRRVLDLATGQVVTQYSTDLSDPGSGTYFYNPIRINGAWWFPEVSLVLFGEGVFWDPWTGVFLVKAWPWLYWPFGPFHPWRPIFRFWPWPWPWPRPWAWPWPRPWPFLWPWPGAWVRPWVIWPLWPWGLRPWWPWWYWRWWWGWTWWGHWWCWHPWWWFCKWWWWPWWHPWWWGGYWWFPWWWWWSCWWWPGYWWWWYWWWWPWWWGGRFWWCWWWWWPRHWWWWPWHWWWWPWWRPPILAPPELGDAPDPPYPSYRRSQGAVHGVWWYEWLGVGRDGEWDSDQVDADWYDDGVAVDLSTSTLVFTPTVSSPWSPRYGPSSVLNVHGWFDWNGDGDWDDAGELVVNWWGYPGDGTWPGGQGSFGVARSFTIPSTVFGSGDVADLWLRFRLDYAHNLTSPRGYTRFGEVEDHKLTVIRPRRPIWADWPVVSPIASLVVTYTRVVTAVSVSITPTVAITPTWTIAANPLATQSALAGEGNQVTIEHEPFTAGQRYTVALSSGTTYTGTGVVLPGGFSFTANWAASLYLPVVIKGGP
jgi:YD repeat-containing protein